MLCMILCTFLGLVSGIVITILDRNCKPLLLGTLGGAIAGVLATYVCYLCINLFNVFLAELNANL